MRRPKKKRVVGSPVPRIEKCAYCHKGFDLNGWGWVANGSGHLLCGHDCFIAFWKRSERIEKGEATWMDIQSLK